MQYGYLLTKCQNFVEDIVKTDMITAILSVITGGVITIYTSNLVNRKMLKKEHALDDR